MWCFRLKNLGSDLRKKQKKKKKKKNITANMRRLSRELPQQAGANERGIA